MATRVPRPNGRRLSVCLSLPWVIVSMFLGQASMNARDIAHEATLEDVAVEDDALVLARGLLTTTTEQDEPELQQLRAASHRAVGRATSPVVDLLPERETDIRSTQAIELVWFGEEPVGTEVRLALRTGRTPVPANASWTAWLELPAAPGTPYRVAPLAGRFAQWRALLLTQDGGVSPRVRRVHLRIAGSGSTPFPAIPMREPEGVDFP